MTVHCRVNIIVTSLLFHSVLFLRFIASLYDHVCCNSVIKLPKCSCFSAAKKLMILFQLEMKHKKRRTVFVRCIKIKGEVGKKIESGDVASFRKIAVRWKISRDLGLLGCVPHFYKSRERKKAAFFIEDIAMPGNSSGPVPFNNPLLNKYLSSPRSTRARVSLNQR